MSETVVTSPEIASKTHLIFTRLIKTITKFSNVIGYQQPDLSIGQCTRHACNWTVRVILRALFR